jgi:hypothetical protein
MHGTKVGVLNETTHGGADSLGHRQVHAVCYFFDAFVQVGGHPNHDLLPVACSTGSSHGNLLGRGEVLITEVT